MEQITKERFDGLMGSTRSPLTLIAGIEREWYSEQNEKVLGVIVQDAADDDFLCIVLGRDRIGRYRAVHLSPFVPSIDTARMGLPNLLTDWGARDPREYEQGDENRQQMDFFTPRHPAEGLNPTFAKLVSEEGYSPARGIIEAMMFYFEDPDGNFVEQFQSTAFNARLWELYLFALLAEERSLIDRTHPAPDYLFSGISGEAFIEAVTVNPSGVRRETGYPKDPADRENYLKKYLPKKFGRSLRDKLGRRYWEKPYIGQRPIILAIADFHYPQSMTLSQPSLKAYLYGRWIDTQRDQAGRLPIEPQRIAEHSRATKRVRSGFFNLPDAQNISAVVSVSEDTIAKFNRMGLRAGFGSRRVHMTATGKRYREHPTIAAPEEFDIDVTAPSYQEYWIDGLQVYHNPKAAIPLSINMFSGATHHFLRGEVLEAVVVEGSPFDIVTSISVDGQGK